MPEKPKIFISHSWDDNEISRRIAQSLKRDGAKIWIDYARISGGESFPEKMNEGLEWCDQLVLVWTAAAAKSYYVKLEWQATLTAQKRIIPCVLDHTKLPVILGSMLYIPFQDFETGYPHLARALNLPIKPATPKIKPVPAEPIVTAIPEPPQSAGNLPQRSSFRSKPRDLSVADVEAMLAEKNFFDSIWNKNSAGITHQYEPQTIANDRVVIDHASGAMWQRGGSDKLMDFKEAHGWINDLNRKGYAGFKDWRLPTLEEAMSLVERVKKNGVYIDPVFDAAQRWIWTADSADDATGAWVGSFSDGFCYRDRFFDSSYVRAVRSGQAFQE